MGKWQISKAVLYSALSLFIFIFNNSIMNYVGILVGSVVCLYAIEELAICVAKKTIFSDAYYLFDGIAQLFIGIILFIVSGDIIKVCLVWGVWSILRESKGLAEGIKNLSAKKIEIINVLESVIIIVLSFIMILEPDEAHAHLHVILLGVELILVVLFYFMEVIGNRISRRNSENPEKSDDTEEISL